MGYKPKQLSKQSNQSIQKANLSSENSQTNCECNIQSQNFKNIVIEQYQHQIADLNIR